MRATLWDKTHGMRDLKDILTGYGLNLGGWTLREVRAITPDGRTIVGYGSNPQGKTEGWIATLPPDPIILIGRPKHIIGARQ